MAQKLRALAAGSLATLTILSATITRALTAPYPDESFKKITAAPREPANVKDDAAIVDEKGNIVDGEFAPRRGNVQVLPAPDVTELTTGHAPASAKPASKSESQTKVKPTATPVAKKQPAPEDSKEANEEADSAVKAEPVAAEPLAKTPEPKKAVAVAAEQSLRWLTNGNNRFVKKANRADGRSPADRKRLLAGQNPHAIILSCSDSRVPAELVFDQALGEIISVRVAGEALDASVIATIEDALENLNPKLLIVMGHTSCSTVEAALKFKEGTSAGSEFLDKALAEIRPHLKTVKTDAPSAGLEVESTLNADGTARDLVRRSEVIRRKIESGDLVIKTALYRLETGKVTFY